MLFRWIIVIKCLCQIFHKLNTNPEIDNIISDHIKCTYVHQTLRFTFLIKFASMFQHY
jgi:hypothetical protein